MSKKMFDFVLGNPPFQRMYQGDSNGANSIYDKFLDASFEIADKVELIHPARFLFNAGSTSKKWNEKMLGDPHFKVLFYEKDATIIFPNADIKGGIAITYHDDYKNFGAIGVFTPYEQLNNILHKVSSNDNFESINVLGTTSSAYHFTEALHSDYPNLKKEKIIINGKEQPLLSKGHEYDLKSSIFEKLPNIFIDHIKDEESNHYIKILGKNSAGRTIKYIKKKYINEVKNLYVFKIFLPKANGNGAFGEVITMPTIAEPGTGATETFYSLGLFNSRKEAERLLKYIKTKFARALLGILKITQDSNPGKWKYVPLQDFTDHSDIDWSKSIPEIDQQLYKKYGLSDEEIDFIETHVKEMK